MKNNLINDIVNTLQIHLSADQLRILKDTLTLKFDKYDIHESHHELMSPDDTDRLFLSEFISIKKLEGKSPKTLKRYYDIVSLFLSAATKSLTQIQTQDLRYYLLTYKKNRNVSNCTLDGMRRCLSSFFSWLSAEGHISKNPCIGLSQIKYSKTIKKPFSSTEIEKIKQACTNDRDLALVEFLYYSGCRVSEIVNLDRDHINFITGEAVVLGKGNKERTIYLTPVALMRLQDYLLDRSDCNSCLFASKKSPHHRLSKEGIESILRKLGGKSGVPKVHPHRFRRTLATNLLDRGMNIQDVAQILGHADLKTTQIYCYISQSNVKSAYTRYAA